MAKIIEGEFEGKHGNIICWTDSRFKINVWDLGKEVYIKPTAIEFTAEEMQRLYDNQKMRQEVLNKYQLTFNLRLVKR